MATFFSPGVKVTVAASGQAPIARVTTSVGGITAKFQRGPVAVPVRLGSYPEGVAVFGGFYEDYEGPKAMWHWFRNGGGPIWGNRTAHYTNIASPVTLQAITAARTLQDQAVVPVDTLLVEAYGQGDWGDDIRVGVANGSQVNDFTLSVYYSADNGVSYSLVEAFRGLVMDDTSPNFVESVVNSRSFYIRVTDLDSSSTSPTDRPAVGTYYFGERGGPHLQFGTEESTANAVTISDSDSTLQSLLNAIKGTYNTHLADETVHIAADVANVVVAANASDVTLIGTIVTLANELRVDYEAHRILTTGAVHTAADVTNVIVAAVSTNLATAITLLNDLSVKYSAHRVLLTSHAAGDTNAITAVTATEIDTAILLAADIRTQYEAHRVDLTPHGAADTTNVVTAPTTTFNGGGHITLVNELRTDYEAHRVFLTSHQETDTVNVISAPAATTIATAVTLANELKLDYNGHATQTSATLGDDGDTGFIEADVTGNAAAKTGVFALDVAEDLNIVFFPEFTTVTAHDAGHNYCEDRADCFYIGALPLNTSESSAETYMNSITIVGRFAALYYPFLKVKHPVTGSEEFWNPCGAVGGRYGFTDRTRGVHKAPAGSVEGALSGVIDVEVSVSQSNRDVLYPARLNTIIKESGGGIIIFGNITTAVDPNFESINIVRLLIAIASALEVGTRFAIFEPNDPILWGRIRSSITSFLTGFWKEGALFGASASEAFYVGVDDTNNTTATILQKKVVIDVGVAPTRPAEFVDVSLVQVPPGGIV